MAFLFFIAIYFYFHSGELKSWVDTVPSFATVSEEKSVQRIDGSVKKSVLLLTITFKVLHATQQYWVTTVTATVWTNQKSLTCPIIFKVWFLHVLGWSNKTSLFSGIWCFYLDSTGAKLNVNFSPGELSLPLHYCFSAISVIHYTANCRY